MEPCVFAGSAEESAIWNVSSLEYGYSIGGVVKENQKLSGTNVELVLNVFVSPVPVIPGEDPPQPGPKVLQGTPRIKNVVLKLVSPSGAEEIVHSESETYPLPSHPNSYPSFRFRIATTWWNDGAEIKVKPEATFEFDYILPGSGSGTDVVSDFKPQFTFVAYNRLQLLGARYNEDGSEGSPQWMQLFDLLGFKDVSIALCDAFGKRSHGTFQVSPSAAASVSETRQQVLDRLTGATMFAATPHGDPTSIYDSFYKPNVPQSAGDHVIQFDPSVYQRVQAKNANPNDPLPAFQFVGLWSCRTLTGAPPEVAAASFGIGPTSQGRAFLGFSANVSSYTWNLLDKPKGFQLEGTFTISEYVGRLPDATLADHADLFALYARGGSTSILTALDGTHVQFRPVAMTLIPATDSDPAMVQVVTVLPTVVGDSNTTLKFVYQGLPTPGSIYWLYLGRLL